MNNEYLNHNDEEWHMLLQSDQYRHYREIFNASNERKKADKIKESSNKEIKRLEGKIEDLKLEVKELESYNQKYTYKFPWLFIRIKKAIKQKVANW